jgi:hypothetical protein
MHIHHNLVKPIGRLRNVLAALCTAFCSYVFDNHLFVTQNENCTTHGLCMLDTTVNLSSACACAPGYEQPNCVPDPVHPQGSFPIGILLLSALGCIVLVLACVGVHRVATWRRQGVHGTRVELIAVPPGT